MSDRAEVYEPMLKKLNGLAKSLRDHPLTEGVVFGDESVWEGQQLVRFSRQDFTWWRAYRDEGLHLRMTTSVVAKMSLIETALRRYHSSYREAMDALNPRLLAALDEANISPQYSDVAGEIGRYVLTEGPVTDFEVQRLFPPNAKHLVSSAVSVMNEVVAASYKDIEGCHEAWSEIPPLVDEAVLVLEQHIATIRNKYEGKSDRL